MNAKFERGDQEESVDSGSKYVYCARYANDLYVYHNAMT